MKVSMVSVEVKELEGRRDRVVIENEDQITNYYRIRQQLHRLEGEMQASLQPPPHTASHFLLIECSI